jgi:hypothetical protein
VFTDFAARNLRARLYRTAATEGGSSAEVAEQTERDLRQAREQANKARTDAEHAKAEAERIAASTSYQLGLTLVETARGRRRITSLPGSLVRVWRGSGNRGPGASAGSPTPGRLGGAVSARSSTLAATSDILLTGGSEDRLFVAYSGVAIGARTTPVILGIVTDATAGSFAPDATVNRVTPNDALLVLERCEPDLVLVEAAACAPSHPWAFAGGGASVDRARVLLDLVDRARASGRPAVLIRDVRSAAHVGLVALEDRFDLVVDADHGPDGEPSWSRGVQLARFNPLGGRSMREDGPLFIGGLDPHARLRERSLLTSTLTAASDHALDICLDADAPPGWDEIPAELRESVSGRIAWEDLPSRYRRTSLVIANPFAPRGPARTVDVRTLEQLACGVRILSGRNDALDTLAGAHVTATPEDGDPAQALATALQTGVPDHAAMRRLLRALFLDHASSIKLARLIRALALDARPATNRSSTALVSLGADADIPRFVESILDQVQPPTAVLLALGDGATWPGTADEALTSGGVEVHATAAPSGDPDRPQGDGDPTHAWLAVWPTGRPIAPTYLLDLLVGGEMSGADGVGYQPDDDYRFVEALDPGSSIVRRAALREIGGWRRALLGDPTGQASWGDLGWRLLSVGPEDIR